MGGNSSKGGAGHGGCGGDRVCVGGDDGGDIGDGGSGKGTDSDGLRVCDNRDEEGGALDRAVVTPSFQW